MDFLTSTHGEEGTSCNGKYLRNKKVKMIGAIMPSIFKEWPTPIVENSVPVNFSCSLNNVHILSLFISGHCIK